MCTLFQTMERIKRWERPNSEGSNMKFQFRLLIQILLISFALIVCLPEPSIAGGTPEIYQENPIVSREVVNGYFRSINEKMTIVLETSYFTNTLEIKNTDGEILASHDCLESCMYFGLCRSPISKKDIIMFSSWSGSPTVPGDLMAAKFNPKSQKFDVQLIEEAGADNFAGINGDCDCNWEIEAQLGRQAKAIIKKLQPSPEPFVLPDPVSEGSYKQKLEFKVFDIQSFELKLHKFKQLDSYRSQFKTLIDTDRWKVIMLSYVKLYDSDGVVCALNKKDNLWFSFYNVPSGGCDIEIFTSEETQMITPDKMRIELSVNNFYKGFYRWFDIDLAQMQVSPADL